MKKSPHLLISIWLLGFIFLFSCDKAEAYMNGNGIGNGYCDPLIATNCPSKPTAVFELSMTYSEPIESMVERIGAAFLGANSDFLDVLRNVESKNYEGFNIHETSCLLDECAYKLKCAMDIYRDLIAKAESTPYNPDFIKKLVEFNYPEYMRKYSLQNNLFMDVRTFLSVGDLTGYLYFQQSKLINVYKLVLQLRAELMVGGNLTLSKLWWINEKFAELNLTGQYASRVFLTV